MMRALAAALLALFAAPCLGLAGIGLPLQVYLPPFYSAQLGVNLSAVGVAFMVVRLLDIAIDPTLGVLMDRTRVPFGRFKAWLTAGVPLLMLGSVVLFFSSPGVTAVQLAIGLALAYGGWSVCVVAQTSWGALLSPSYNERSRIYGWWQMFNLLGLLRSARRRTEGRGKAAVEWRAAMRNGENRWISLVEINARRVARGTR